MESPAKGRGVAVHQASVHSSPLANTSQLLPLIAGGRRSAEELIAVQAGGRAPQQTPKE